MYTLVVMLGTVGRWTVANLLVGCSAGELRAAKSELMHSRRMLVLAAVLAIIGQADSGQAGQLHAPGPGAQGSGFGRRATEAQN